MSSKVLQRENAVGDFNKLNVQILRKLPQNFDTFIDNTAMFRVTCYSHPQSPDISSVQSVAAMNQIDWMLLFVIVGGSYFKLIWPANLFKEINKHE